MKRFGELGLSVNISEVDVRDTLFPGSAETRSLAQRLAYQQLTAACTLEPACEAITFWGFTDNYSWLLEEGDLNPLLFDRNYQKKPAYQGVLDGLAGKLPVRGPNLLANADFAAGDDAWSARSGTLSVDIAEGHDGHSACIDGRIASTDGLVQAELLPALSTGGPLSFSAWVFASSTSTVDGTLSITEDGAEPRALNIATTLVQAGHWRELSGYLALGYEGTPSAVSLEIAGPEPDVTLCVAGVRLEPLSIE